MCALSTLCLSVNLEKVWLFRAVMQGACATLSFACLCVYPSNVCQNSRIVFACLRFACLWFSTEESRMQTAFAPPNKDNIVLVLCRKQYPTHETMVHHAYLIIRSVCDQGRSQGDIGGRGLLPNSFLQISKMKDYFQILKISTSKL